MAKVNVLNLMSPAESKCISYFVCKTDGRILEEYDYYREPLEVQKNCIQVPTFTIKDYCQFATNYLKDNPEKMKKWNKKYKTSEVNNYSNFSAFLGDRFSTEYSPYSENQIKERMKEWCFQNHFDVYEESKPKILDFEKALEEMLAHCNERLKDKKRMKFYKKNYDDFVLRIGAFTLLRSYTHEGPGVRVFRLYLNFENRGTVVKDIRKYFIKENTLYVVGDKYAVCRVKKTKNNILVSTYYESDNLDGIPKKYQKVFRTEKFKRFIPKKEIIDPNKI